MKIGDPVYKAISKPDVEVITGYIAAIGEDFVVVNWPKGREISNLNPKDRFGNDAHDTKAKAIEHKLKELGYIQHTYDSQYRQLCMAQSKFQDMLEEEKKAS